MPITVFIADDHTVVREGLQALLETDSRIRVVGHASDGRNALRQVKELCPDVVLMDIAMPELNGIDATEQIMEVCPSSTRVIILSMHSSREHISRALTAGARGYILKESAAKEVIRAVHAVRSGIHYLSHRIAGIVFDDYVKQQKAGLPPSPLDLLSPREREVLQLVVEGKSSSQIADAISLSPKTVDTYRSRLMQKLNITNVPDLVKFAIRHGLISLDP
ncbi:MAG TPA: response regulator transcription factor [Desulfobacteraceae bacterium]|nr:response regulator transcription factor [Desulfobacteraceae bacterium]